MPHQQILGYHCTYITVELSQQPNALYIGVKHVCMKASVCVVC